MNDLIQTAINVICQDCCNRDYCGDCFFHGAKQAIDVLKALPAADVQPKDEVTKAFSDGFEAGFKRGYERGKEDGIHVE